MRYPRSVNELPRLDHLVSISALFALLLGCGDASPNVAPDAGAPHSDPLIRASLECVESVVRVQRDCLAAGLACPDHMEIVAAEAAVREAFAEYDADARAAAGFSTGLDPMELGARLGEACVGAGASFVAHTFGGPEGVLRTPNDLNAECLDAVAFASLDVYEAELRALVDCVDEGPCGLAELAASRDAARAAARAATEASCGSYVRSLRASPDELFDDALDEARCGLAELRPEHDGVDVDCGPRAEVEVPSRGAWTQITLDPADTNTRCGDGGPYAFWIRLADEGQPIDRVAFHLQGGGVCVFPDQCAQVAANSPGLLSSVDQTTPPTTHVMTDGAGNPLRDWTRVYLPYCTQDIFVGAGNAETFEDGLVIHRYGANNMRAAARRVRDILWTALDEGGGAGYRPSRVQVHAQGNSAGGFGILYNYQFFVDTLRWENTTAAPIAALALGGGAPSIAGLFFIQRRAWALGRQLPSYCRTDDCAVGDTMLLAHAARLAEGTAQRFLVVSNQVDGVQVGTTFYPSTAAWVNDARALYCDTRDTPRVHFFMPANGHPSARGAALERGRRGDAGRLVRRLLGRRRRHGPARSGRRGHVDQQHQRRHELRLYPRLKPTRERDRGRPGDVESTPPRQRRSRAPPRPRSTACGCRAPLSRCR